MKFSMQFDLDNAAFDAREAGLVGGIQDVLNDINRKVGHGLTEGDVCDHNGNKIGAWAIDGLAEKLAETPAAFYVSDPGGFNIERHPLRMDRHDDTEAAAADAYADARRSADALRAETIEERTEAGEDYPDDPAHVSFGVGVEYADGTETCEHRWG